jgi:hypothetical protein
MSADRNSPATKADIQLIMTEIGRLYAANEQWKDELIEHFDLAAEDIKHNFESAFHDKLEQHDDRIKRLERHVKLLPA